MKLYDGGRAPNPRRVRIFLAEKGVSVPMEPVDLGALEHKTAAYTAINPLQRVPALMLDDGTIITESMAICRYFEALRPEPPLFGRGGREAALVEMWNRRIELNLYERVYAVFRHLHPAMRVMENQIPEWGEANRPRAIALLALLDRELGGRLYVAGEHSRVADLTRPVPRGFLKATKRHRSREIARPRAR